MDPAVVSNIELACAFQKKKNGSSYYQTFKLKPSCRASMDHPQHSASRQRYGALDSAI
jgi:hypothetical protein